jgi:hypothetical protein
MNSLTKIAILPKQKKITAEFLEDDSIKTASINYKSVALTNDSIDGTLLLHFDLIPGSPKKDCITVSFAKTLEEWLPVDTRKHYWYLQRDSESSPYRTITWRKDCFNQSDAEEKEGEKVEGLSQFGNKRKIHEIICLIPPFWELTDSQCEYCLERLTAHCKIIGIYGSNPIDQFLNPFLERLTTQTKEETSKEQIIDVCLEAFALEFLISLRNPSYFNFVIANCTPRALWNANYESQYGNDGYDIRDAIHDGKPIKELMPYLAKIMNAFKYKVNKPKVV